MRYVTGEILLPPNAPQVTAARVHIEVRDVSLSDAPSVVLAEQDLDQVPLRPTAQIPFSLAVPEVEPTHSLSLRVHVDVDGSGRLAAGDLLTTANLPIPTSGEPAPLRVHVILV